MKKMRRSGVFSAVNYSNSSRTYLGRLWSLTSAPNLSCMTSNRSVNNCNSHSGIWCHPQGAEVCIRKGRIVVTKHICHKVAYRASKTIRGNLLWITTWLVTVCGRTNSWRRGQKTKVSRGEGKRQEKRDIFTKGGKHGRTFIHHHCPCMDFLKLETCVLD